MSDRLWRAVWFYPASLFAGILVLERFSGDGVGVLLGFLLALGFGSATAFGLLRHPVWVWLGYSLLVSAVGVPIAYASSSGEFWLGLAVGVLVGSPFLWLEFAWREGFSPAVRILSLETAFVAGEISIAALVNPVPSNAGSLAWEFLSSMGRVVNGQIQAIESLLAGTGPVRVPLESAFNPLYTALGGIALVALVVSYIAPRTALEEPLPWSWFRFARPATPRSGEPEGLPLRPGQIDALATRTRATPPDTLLSPGFGSLIAAGVLVALFVYLAATVPTYALLGLVVASSVGIAAVALALSRRLTPQGGLRG
jgi:hypothetical protein